MRKIYLFTNINDRNRGPVQEVVSPNENVCIYIDNEFYTVCTAVPDPSKTCIGCVLYKWRPNRICSIKVKQGNHIFPSQSVCNYDTNLKSIEDVLENL